MSTVIHFHHFKEQLVMINSRTGMAGVLAAALLLLPLQASALSVRQFESETRDQQTEFLMKAVDKIVADVARVNPGLSRAIHDYFDLTPPGAVAAPGKIAFFGELGAVENLAGKGKMDLDKVQVEGILLDIVKTDIMPKQAAKDKQTTTDTKK